MKQQVRAPWAERSLGLRVGHHVSHGDHHACLLHLRVRLGCWPTTAPYEVSQASLYLRDENVDRLHIVVVEPRHDALAKQSCVLKESRSIDERGQVISIP